MSFRSRLIAGYAAMVVLIAGIAGSAIVALRLTASRSERIAHAMSDELVAVEQLRFQAEQVVAISRGYLLTGKPAYRDRFESGTEELGSALRDLRRAHLTPTGEVLAFAVELAGRRYVAGATEAARQRASHTDPSAVLPYFDEILKPLRDDFESRAALLAEHERARFDALLVRSQAFTRHAELVLLIASALAMAIALALAGLVVRRLSAHYSRLQIAQREAQRAAAARDELLAVVSHDLRNPLNSIALASSLLEDIVVEDGRRNVRVVRNASERMLYLINQLLVADSLDSDRVVLHVEQCDVRRVVDEVLEMFRLRATELGVDLRAEQLDDWVSADRERLIEILSNLVGNALDHTPRGGAVTVRTERLSDTLRFVVSDTGSGIPADQLDHVFERNWRGSRRSKSGFGLGLYICKRLVEAHAGTIGARSVFRSGSSFWFCLPDRGCPA